MLLDWPEYQIAVWLLAATLWLWVALMLMIGGCAAIARHQHTQMRSQFLRELKYYRDPRTGLCFAVREGGSGGIAVVDSRHWADIDSSLDERKGLRVQLGAVRDRIAVLIRTGEDRPKTCSTTI